MYGKEIDTNIIQKGGTNQQASEPINKNTLHLHTGINNIIDKKGLVESAFDGFQNIFNKSKLLRILIMVFFYTFFYNMLLNIFSFFDVDTIYSYTYILV